MTWIKYYEIPSLFYHVNNKVQNSEWNREQEFKKILSIFTLFLCIPIWQTCLLGRYLCCKFIRVDTFKYQISTASMWIVCRIFSVYIKRCYFLFAFDLEKGIFFFVKKVLIVQLFHHFSMMQCMNYTALWFQQLFFPILPITYFRSSIFISYWPRYSKLGWC